MVLDDALTSPELSARQLAWEVTDAARIYVSKSTTSCILKGEALVEKGETVGFKWFQGRSIVLEGDKTYQ
jgi:hypothetical protein